MKIKILILSFLLAFSIASCTKEYNCDDLQISQAFINFLPSDIDTFILRKFKATGNYQNLVDTFIVKYSHQANYQTSNDTTTVFVTDGKNGIKAGFDWQIFIPAKNRTVFIADIVSEKKTGKRGYGIFSMDPAPGCTNEIFSARLDNQTVSFSNVGTTKYYLSIRN